MLDCQSHRPSSFPFALTRTARAVSFLACSLAIVIPAAAAADQPADAEIKPQVVEVTGERSDEHGFAAQRANSSTKSDLSLLETPQSVSVLTRDLLDARAVTTVAEALQSSAGVSAGSWGRRGWDDFTIRGQRASESLYIDGLKRGQNVWVGQEVFGVERIEVLKGPASINFGLVQPGGLVNMISKRPLAGAFNEFGATYGSHAFKQLDFDLGRPLSESGRAALRINGMWSDQDDPVDQVYFKKRYLAPSLSLDLGPRTEFTILASYAEREYLRNQGVPVKGTILANPNGPVDRDQFNGEPAFGPYHSRQATLGYSLVHRFDSGWKLGQNARWLDMEVDGRFVSLGAVSADGRTQSRNASIQDVQGSNRALDTYLERDLMLGSQRHTLLAGLDLNSDKERYGATSCRMPAIGLYAPVYGQAFTCPATPNSRNMTGISYAGLYLRDRIGLSERLDLSLALRHDRVRNALNNELADRTTVVRESANTGSAGLLYRLTPHVSPYVSFATSFLPVSGSDFFGQQFKPEEGKQAEIGAKFEFDNGRITGGVALFDLKRRNVTTADPNEEHIAILPSAQVQTGEEQTRGVEFEAAADLRNGWKLQGALSVLDGVVTEDNTGIVGKRLQNVPRRSASLWASYQARSGAFAGLGAGMGLRYESEKTGPSVSYVVPGYTAIDANLSYRMRHVRLTLSVKNLFDRDYYAGVLNNNVLPLGDPRTVMLRAVTDF
ncbi:TonB-dependent siderophore receptor [Massilia sp.]|uniref:TonB-dependent siderophore receptor n=1 Tax=Massilia sp. TaxID=1882437 RepID=UPI00289E75DD|nr:TonB-dependent siderophore receptor [Massilia sp.]